MLTTLESIHLATCMDGLESSISRPDALNVKSYWAILLCLLALTNALSSITTLMPTIPPLLIKTLYSIVSMASHISIRNNISVQIISQSLSSELIAPSPLSKSPLFAWVKPSLNDPLNPGANLNILLILHEI